MNWHNNAPWIVRISLAIVIAVAFATPFLLEPTPAVLIGAPLLVAALGGWIGWRLYAKAVVPPTVNASSVISREPQSVVAATSASELQAELDKLRLVQSELLLAKQQAEAAMMAKSEFLATMSHEIRTPLNGIIPLLDILLSTKLAADQRDYLQTAYKSARELLRIVDDILDYSKIEASKLELESVGLNLKEVLDTVRRLLEKNAEAKGLKFLVAIDPGVRLAVRGDPVRLRQVLTNLVSNAIKFTERGSITIQVSKRGETRSHNEIMFVVKDSGMGIAAHSAEKLFQPFSQADASTTRIHGGTGLGLVICKRIVDLMGGKIGVKSELGKGSAFWFSVPFLKAVGDVASARSDLTGARALVLTAEPIFMRRLSGYFAAWSMIAMQTNGAPDALAKLRTASSMGDTWAYDVLVLDMSLMRGNAVALVRNITRDPGMAKLRVVAVMNDEPMPIELTTEPRVGAVPKQYSETELGAVLRKLLEVAEPGRAPSLMPLPIEDEPAHMQIAALDPAAPPLAGHVLLVEDNPVNRQVAQRLLSLVGISFAVAENGKEANDLLDRQAFDVVLMDCQMPVMDGYTATRVRRQKEANSATRRIPIIAMTANAMAGDREKCLNAGMDDYMSKPLNRALLAQTLRKWLPQDALSHTPTATTASAPAASTAPAFVAPRSAPATASVAREAATALDQEVIRDLLDVMGEEFTDLVRVYLEDTPKSVGALEISAQRGDITAMIAPSHSLKSTSANLGAMHLSELARRIEHGARSGELGSDPLTLSTALRQEYERVALALNGLLATSP